MTIQKSQQVRLVDAFLGSIKVVGEVIEIEHGFACVRWPNGFVEWRKASDLEAVER